MHLLIVDDEPLIRQRIHTILDVSPVSFASIREASNAVEALALLEELPAGILISDIRMPRTSGLELAEAVRRDYPDTIVLLITGYSDFEYAQAAIRHNVYAYILKPVDPGELLSTVARARRELERREKQRKLYRVFQQYFTENQEALRSRYLENLLFHSHRERDGRSALFQIDFSHYRVAAIRCEGASGPGSLEEEYYCTAVTEQYIRRSNPGACTAVFGNLVFLVWEIRGGDVFADSKALAEFAREVRNHIRSSLLGDLRMGVSPASRSVEEIQNLRKQAVEALDLLSGREGSSLLFYEDILEVDQSSWSISDDLELLSQALRAGNGEVAAQVVRGVGESTSGRDPDYALTTCRLLVSSTAFLLHELKLGGEAINRLTGRAGETLTPENLATWGVAGLAGWLESWIREVAGEIASLHSRRRNSLVDGVYEFINAHYTENVGLAEASRAVGRNPSYISRLIKEYTGATFVQLLTEKRITEAKRLLQEGKHRVSDIAAMTGYPNTRYFNRVFKAMVNMAPNDYRNIAGTFR